MLGYLLLTLLPVAALAYLVWYYRKRAAERAAASSKRFAEMFGTVTGAKPRLSATLAVASQAAAVPLCVAKDTVCDALHAALFRALCSGFPEFHVFPQVSLGALVQLPPALQGREREQRLRAIAQNTVDCLVCDRDARVIAAIDREGGAGAEYHIKSAYLAAAGLRYLRLDPAALPVPDDIRKMVLSSAGAKSA